MFNDRRAAAGLFAAALAFLAATAPGPAFAADRLLGGYTKQDPAKPEFRQVVKAAEDLLETRFSGRGIRLTRLLEVHTQVVAGLNYKLVCAYADRQGSGKAELVVYRNLAGRFSLTDASMTDDAAKPEGGEKQARFEYATAFGGLIVVELLDGDRIAVSYGKARHELPRAVSGSGARYAADGVAFWMKGNDATFENKKTGERVRCSRRY